MEYRIPDKDLTEVTLGEPDWFETLCGFVDEPAPCIVVGKINGEIQCWRLHFRTEHDHEMYGTAVRRTLRRIGFTIPRIKRPRRVTPRAQFTAAI